MKGVDVGEALLLKILGKKIRKVNWIFKSFLLSELHLVGLFFFTCNTIRHCIDCDTSACSDVTSMDGYDLVDWNQHGDGGVSNVWCTIHTHRSGLG